MVQGNSITCTLAWQRWCVDPDRDRRGDVNIGVVLGPFSEREHGGGLAKTVNSLDMLYETHNIRPLVLFLGCHATFFFFFEDMLH